MAKKIEGIESGLQLLKTHDMHFDTGDAQVRRIVTLMMREAQDLRNTLKNKDRLIGEKDKEI